MEYKLTSKHQHSVKGNNGKRRNNLLYFLNGILILKQKMPYDENYDKGWEIHTKVYNEYILNGNLHQNRQYSSVTKKKKIREVKYPISKKILEQFNIPKNTKIYYCNDKI